MKKIKIFACVLTMVGFASCDDYLSEVPDNRTLIDSEDKVSELLVGAYPMSCPYTFLEAMSDNTTDNMNTSLGSQENTLYYTWELGKLVNTDSPSGYWDACYGAIAYANQALEAIDALEDTPRLRLLKSEALLSRAYAHFMLVNVWAKNYDPNTASSDLGVPYVKAVESSLIVNYTRNTVQEVYDLIEADLLEGLKNAGERTDKNAKPKYHFGLAAGKAFAARFYLTKGEFDKVLEYSSDLGSKPRIIRDWKFESKIASVEEQTRDYSGVQRETNLLVSTVPSGYMRTFAYDRYSSSSLSFDQIMGRATNPLGKKFYYDAPLNIGNRDNALAPKVNEYFKTTNPTAGTGFAFYRVILFSNDELYLNRIEALVMTNRLDEALSELEYFIGTRTDGYVAGTDKLTKAMIMSKYGTASSEFSPFYSMTDEQAAFVKAIAEAKRRDLIHEGNRWFDIKRFNLVVNHKMGLSTEVLVKDDLRRVMQIPDHVVAAGLKPNVR